MSKIVFDASDKRLYFTGVNHCALFLKKSDGSYDNGVAWDGISNATVTPDGGDANDIYADNIKYLSIPGAVNINASITAYNYPKEFNACLGLGAKTDAAGLLFAQQARTKFGIVYKSKIGSAENEDYGYVLNILYNCLAAPSELSSDTVNESPEAGEFSFDISTVAVPESEMPSGMKPTSWVRIECKPGELLTTTGEPTTKLQTLLDTLYGKDAAGQAEASDPTLINPKAIYDILKTV